MLRFCDIVYGGKIKEYRESISFPENCNLKDYLFSPEVKLKFFTNFQFNDYFKMKSHEIQNGERFKFAIENLFKKIPHIYF